MTDELEAWQYASNSEPHNDIERTIKIVKAAYGWSLDDDGRLYGLVSGDMGWASTSIVLDAQTVAIWHTGLAATVQHDSHVWNWKIDRVKDRYSKTIDYLKDH